MNAFLMLLSKDWKCCVRSRQLITATVGFALLLVVVSSFAFRQVGYGQRELQDLTPGIIWLIFLFTSVVLFNHSSVSEHENDAINGLLMTAVSPALVFCSKFIVNLVALLFVHCLVLVLHGILFGVNYFGVFPGLILISSIVSIGVVSLGTLLSMMSTVTKAREVVLPIVLFPLCIPSIAGAVLLTRGLILDGVVQYSDFWFTLIAAFGFIALVLSVNLFEYVAKG